MCLLCGVLEQPKRVKQRVSDSKKGSGTSSRGRRGGGCGINNFEPLAPGVTHMIIRIQAFTGIRNHIIVGVYVQAHSSAIVKLGREVHLGFRNCVPLSVVTAAKYSEFRMLCFEAIVSPLYC